MASITWILVGLAVLVGILLLGLRVNRRKRTARLAVRLAEAYRAHGQGEVARRLYEVPGKLAQNQEAARRGLARLEQGDREPVVEPALVEDAERALAGGREHLEATLAKRGIEIELPELAGEER